MTRAETADWLALPDAIVEFGLSRATLYRLIAAGEVGTGKRVGSRATYIRRTDLDRATRVRPSPSKTRARARHRA